MPNARLRELYIAFPLPPVQPKFYSPSLPTLRTSAFNDIRMRLQELLNLLPAQSLLVRLSIAHSVARLDGVDERCSQIQYFFRFFPWVPFQMESNPL